MKLARFLLPAMLIAGCVSPLVNHTPYANPYFPKEEFERLFTAWKGGRNVSWEVRFRGSSLADQQLVLKSTGEGSLGSRLPGVGDQPQTFNPTKAELTRVVDRLIESGVLGLYDGHYGAWTQGGGVGGPEVRVLIGGMEKHVSKDPGLSGVASWEAGAIQQAADAILEIGLKYIK